MKKRLTLVLSAFIISLMLLLIGGEIIARILFKGHYFRDEINLTYRYDKELGWFPVKNSTKQYKGSRVITIQNNENGFRDINHGPKKKKRIAFIGDSYVWGYDVNYGERFTEYLQARLPDWEIINMGVSGYSTDQELLLIQKWFDHFQPDIVFLVFCDNDMEGNSLNKIGAYHKPYFRISENKLEKCGIPVSKSLPYYVVEYPYLLRSRLVQFTIYLTTQERIVTHNPTTEIIKEMNAFVKSKGARFFMAFTDDYHKGEECSFCKLDSIPSVILTNTYRYDWSKGYHWTPKGNKFVCDKIYDFLKEENALNTSMQIQDLLHSSY